MIITISIIFIWRNTFSCIPTSPTYLNGKSFSGSKPRNGVRVPIGTTATTGRDLIVF